MKPCLVCHLHAGGGATETEWLQGTFRSERLVQLLEVRGALLPQPQRFGTMHVQEARACRAELFVLRAPGKDGVSVCVRVCMPRFVDGREPAGGRCQWVLGAAASVNFTSGARISVASIEWKRQALGRALVGDVGRWKRQLAQPPSTVARGNRGTGFFGCEARTSSTSSYSWRRTSGVHPCMRHERLPTGRVAISHDEICVAAAARTVHSDVPTALARCGSAT